MIFCQDRRQAFLALMFLSKRVMPGTSNFRGGMSAIILGPLLGILNRFSSVKTEANWSLNTSAFCSLFVISAFPDFRVPTPRLSFLVDLMYDQNLLLV